MIRRHLVFPLRPLAGVLLLAAPAALRAESKSVSVTKEALTHTVEFGTPTPGTAVSKSTGVKHDITVNNNASGYDMDSVTTAPDSDSDEGAWRCRESTKSLMKWKITALRNTALAYAINGGITERPPSWIAGLIHSGGPPSPRDHRDFSVTVPAATVVRWNNALGSHASPSAKSRHLIAVGEEVSLNISNSHLGNPVWTATGGWFQAQGTADKKWETSVNHFPVVTWRAPTSAGSYTLTADFPKEGQVSGADSVSGKKATITFDVINPEGEKLTLDHKWGDARRNSDGSQSINAWVVILYTPKPRTVNYSNVGFAEDNTEDACKPKSLSGFHENEYNKRIAAGVLPESNNYIHHPLLGWKYLDLDIGGWPDTALYSDYSPASGSPATEITHYWGSGHYQWDIPVKCKGMDPTLKTPGVRIPGEGYTFYTRIQSFDITSSPNPAIIEKVHGSVSITLSKTDSENTKTGTYTQSATF